LERFTQNGISAKVAAKIERAIIAEFIGENSGISANLGHLEVFITPKT